MDTDASVWEERKVKTTTGGGVIAQTLIPPIPIINFPACARVSGNPVYPIIAYAVCCGYLVLCAVSFIGLRRHSRVWVRKGLWADPPRQASDERKVGQ